MAAFVARLGGRQDYVRRSLRLRALRSSSGMILSHMGWTIVYHPARFPTEEECLIMSPEEANAFSQK